MVTQFGLPLIVPCPPNITGKELYEDVMSQVGSYTASRGLQSFLEVEMVVLLRCDASWTCRLLRYRVERTIRGCFVSRDARPVCILRFPIEAVLQVGGHFVWISVLPLSGGQNVGVVWAVCCTSVLPWMCHTSRLNLGTYHQILQAR